LTDGLLAPVSHFFCSTYLFSISESIAYPTPNVNKAIFANVINSSISRLIRFAPFLNERIIYNQSSLYVQSVFYHKRLTFSIETAVTFVMPLFVAVFALNDFLIKFLFIFPEKGI